MDSEALLDTLLDLKHDLGKHLQLPLALLPKNADARAVRETAYQALLRTRRGQCGDCSARMLWQRFLNTAGPCLSGRPAFESLERAVTRALAWEVWLKQSDACKSACPRADITRDFREVARHIALLVDEVSQDALEQDADGGRADLANDNLL